MKWSNWNLQRSWYRIIERLETRVAPAIVSFRAGINGLSVEDTAIAAAAPSTSAPNSDQLATAGALAPGQARQALLRFDGIIGNGPGQIPPNATIINANLSFWSIGGISNSIQVEFRRILTAWDDSTSSWDWWDQGVQADGVEASTAFDLMRSFGKFGYQVGSQNLKDTVQQWALGQPNNGWLVSSGDVGDFWDFASSDHPDVAKRPCLSVEFTAPGHENPSYEQLAGVPPLPTTLAWFDWSEDLRNRRIERVPSERANTFYFAQNGDDVNGAGTVQSPWRTLAKARETLIASGGQGVRLRFRRGDIWREATDMSLIYRISGYTIDDYGDVTLAKPLLSRFLQLETTNWIQAGGNLYKMINPPSIGWLRETANGLAKVYYREANSAAVAGRLNSWCYDDTGADPASSGVPTLYLNCGGDPAQVVGGFEACPNDGLGWDLTGDNVRVQNLRIEGHGVSKDGQSYGLRILQAGLYPEFVGIGLEVYYTGYHSVGQIAQYQGTRGVVTLVDVSAGYCVNRLGTGSPGSGDIIVFVSYGDYGGNEYYQFDCEARFGALPSADWGAAAGLRHGSVFYCHVGIGGRLELVIVEKTSIADAEYPLQARNSMGNIVPAAGLEDVRAYVVEDQPGGASSQFLRDSIAVINSVVDLTNPPLPYDYHNSVYFYQTIGAWLINCTIKYDARFQVAQYFSFLNGVTNDNSTFINCHVDIFNHPYSTYWQNPFLPAEVHYPGAKLINTIVSLSTTGSTALGLINNALHLQHNAYFLPNQIYPTAGYSGDPGAVVLPRRYAAALRPSPSSPMYDGGIDYGLEYDQLRQPRGALRTIGPLNGSALPMPFSVTAIWGLQGTDVANNSILPSPRITRIQLQFPTDVDLRMGALKLFGQTAEIPWSTFTYDSSTFLAEWTLANPLQRGHYTLELDTQPLRGFAVLPGDFTGDGIVNTNDFALFRSAFGTSSYLGDLDGNGLVDAFDFTLFRQSFGTML